MNAPPDLKAKLTAAWQREFDLSPVISDIRALTAGASSQTYAFQLNGEAHILQMGNDDAAFGTSLNKTLQARTQQAAAQAGVLTPKVVLLFGGEENHTSGFVTRCIAGETLGQRIVGDPALSAARENLPQQCAEVLASIHALAVDDFGFLPQGGADRQLQELARVHRSFDQALPVFEAAFAWLANNPPKPSSFSVVHGDFRTGNLLVSDAGLSAVLDWELAHLGDPMEDLGWLCMRSWRFQRPDLPVGGFARRAELFRAYERSSGRSVDPDAVRYWEMFGTLKWGVICQWFAQRRLSGEHFGLEPLLIGRRVSEVEIQLLDFLQGRDL